MRRRERELLARFRELEQRGLTAEPVHAKSRARPGTDAHERRRLGDRRRDRRAVPLLDRPRAGRDRVHADEPHPGAGARGRGRARARDRLARMLERPEQTLNVVLLLVLVCAADRARTLLGMPARAARSAAPGVVIGLVLEIVVFFVFAEVAPKTYAIQHTDRAALRVSGVPRGRHGLPAAAAARRAGSSGSRTSSCPGKGLKEGPFVTEEEIRTMADVAAEEAAIETRGARAHPLDLRVRRHRRARGDGAAARHGRGRGRRDRRRGDRARDRRRATRGSRATRTPPTTSSGSCS